MFVQTQKTPNPDSLKFLPGKKVSESGPHEILNKNETDNDLIRNILSINGVTGIFLGDNFLSVKSLLVMKRNQPQCDRLGNIYDSCQWMLKFEVINNTS